MARLRLGQILLQAGVCSQGDLVQAWEQKVLFGDRLGTNLLATAAIEEKTLAQALGFQHACASAWAEILKPEPAVLGMLDRALCDERKVLPHHREGDTLFLLMRDPDDDATCREAASVTKLAIVPVVIVEARLWRLHHELLGLSPGLRPVPLDDAARVARARRLAAQQKPVMAAAEGPDLLSEQEFEQLYLSRDTGPVKSMPRPAHAEGTADAATAKAAAAKAATADAATADAATADAATSTTPDVLRAPVDEPTSTEGSGHVIVDRRASGGDRRARPRAPGPGTELAPPEGVVVVDKSAIPPAVVDAGPPSETPTPAAGTSAIVGPSEVTAPTGEPSPASVASAPSATSTPTPEVAPTGPAGPSLTAASTPASAAEVPLELTDTVVGHANPDEVTHPAGRAAAEHSVHDEHVISAEPDLASTQEGQDAAAASPKGGGDYRIELPKTLGAGSWQAGDPRAQSLFASVDDTLETADPLPVDWAAAVSQDVDLDAFEPLTFEEALPRLAEVHTRREIARVVLRYAFSRFKRAALLTVYPGAIVGWKAAPSAFHDAITSVRIDRRERTVFSLVADSRAHYIGPLQTWRGNGAWVKQTGRVLPRSVAVLPILVRGRVLNILYGDNGHDEHVESDVGELLILGQRIAQSYEGLLSEAGLTSPRTDLANRDQVPET